MGEKRGMKALEAWCKKVTDGYQGVKIDNMTTCWRDGLAFCAIIHHFRPDLIDFDNLEKNDIYHNNELAFRTAEHHLGIPALLDAEDMVEYEVPDRLSILTYLSQFYQTFTGSQQGASPTRSLPKRPVAETEQGVLSPVSESPPGKVAERLGRREPCAKCGLPVFIAERLLVNGRTLYHRSCFRCARCQHQLSLANFYETEGGEYCCETCPDEILHPSNVEGDKSQFASQNIPINLDMIGHAGPEDEYSVEFELALDTPTVPNISEGKEQVELKFSKARSDFMSSQLSRPGLQDTKELNSVTDLGKTLAESQQLGINDNKDDVCSLPSHCNALQETNFDHTSYSLLNSNSLNNVDNSRNNLSSESSFVNIDSTLSHGSGGCVQAKCFYTESNISNTVGGSLFSGNGVPLKVSCGSLNSVGGGTQLEARGDSMAVEDNHNKELDSSDLPSSIVKMRLKLFEKSGDTEVGTKASKTTCNNKCALYQKDETISAPLDMLITRSESFGQTDKKLLVEEDKIGLQEGQDGQEKLVGDTDISKEKSFESDEVIEIVGSPLKNESQSHTGDSVEYIGTGYKVANMHELNNSDIPKDTTAIRVMESGNIQTNLTLPKSMDVRQNSDCTYPKELNPFGDDDDEQTNKQNVSYKPSETKVAQEINPFGSSDGEEEIRITVEPPTPPVPVTRGGTKKVLEAPTVCLNPFWSDGEEPSSGDENIDSTHIVQAKHPVPRPRTVVSVTTDPCPVPRKSLLTSSTDKFGSVSSLSSVSSAGGTPGRKKKKPAPAPPRAQDLFPGTVATPSDYSSRASSPCPSLGYSLSPKSSPHHRKSRPAPLPPMAIQETAALSFSEAKLVVAKSEDSSSHSSEWEREKNKKDVTNRNRQSQTSNTITSGPVSPGEQQLIFGPNKSTYGQWKRKKGPAPPRPVPQRRQIKAIPMTEVKRELDDIEVQQQELERQGVTLEETIRDKFDQAPVANDDSSMTPDLEDLVLQLFELVNEKNELFRRQAELMYLRRQQRLEEEHADLEYQIRCLMDVPEHTKTDSDKAREEELIQRLVEVVERRNEVVECLEMDRIREAEEDRSIHSRLGMFSKGKILYQEEFTYSKSDYGKLKKKKKDKDKYSNMKAVKSGLDADKDIDEREEAMPKYMKEKKKSKRKWF
ncbi:MICAL-like protein 1 isoform X2 [Zootermopsis nevadensis]|uniref:MICAL-like protein 2 n=2 Tax=Zootermopsis nevadensis TaxID=136037 RepID=A0A067QLD3_ZOONE|nr:MICAL-like protein 1 isoform X2 [Zootermopsis nevadensis]XP_021938872.1 MICAL-like protein 1 isoform X2 [Zootermopsis nevadensis]XP_021938873.1 MICAL-like protein 1 isoform X2 [Zootermopsis nevadensis]XP_021938874.1 MICAL-like protein 1 isoform X2 [Zootermopsis nevadensis]KDR08841.1 MICAL-like protein 2 [Zootermopsis nevadensis]